MLENTCFDYSNHTTYENLCVHSEDSTAQDATRETLSKLINARFVERCPDPEPHLSPPSEEEAPARKRTKSSKVLALKISIAGYSCLLFQ